MDRKNALALYLIGTLGQIWIICTITFILRNYGICVDFTTPIGVIAIGIGGTSSALWGIIIAVKYMKFSLKYILKDFVYDKSILVTYLYLYSWV